MSKSTTDILKSLSKTGLGVEPIAQAPETPPMEAQRIALVEELSEIANTNLNPPALYRQMTMSDKFTLSASRSLVLAARFDLKYKAEQNLTRNEIAYNSIELSNDFKQIVKNK